MAIIGAGSGFNPVPGITSPGGHVPGPESDPEAWDKIVLGGQTWPGFWKVNTSGEARDVQKKKAQGKDGYRLHNKGMTGLDMTLHGTFHEREYGQVVNLIPSITPRRPGGLKTPITISHPVPAMLRVDKIYIVRVKPVQPGTGRDFFTLEIKAIEWFPEPKDVKTKDDSGKSEAEAKTLENALNHEAISSGAGRPLYRYGEDDPGPNGLDFIDQLGNQGAHWQNE